MPQSKRQRGNMRRVTVAILLVFLLGFATGYITRNVFASEADTTAADVEPRIIWVYQEPAEAKPDESAATLETLAVTASAYCPCVICCADSADGITSTGTIATEGRTIAVDPSVIPYGTEVIFGGNKYIAEDCGGAIKGNRIDVFFDSHEDALQFGRQELNVFFYK